MNEDNVEVEALDVSEDDTIPIEIHLPNGDKVEKNLTYEEVCYWVSLGMYLTHGFHAITTQFMAEQMDEMSSVEDQQEKAIN